MVTQKMLDQLRAERSKPDMRLDYTIDSPIHTHVVSSLSAEREKQIVQGEHCLESALEDFRREQALSSSHGIATVQFNQSTTSEEVTP